MALLLLLALPVIMLLRLIVKREKGGEEEGVSPLWSKFSCYCRASRIELVATCAILPAFLIMSIYYRDDN
jgi:hypothetical protein